MRRFRLNRVKDFTGMSGTGIVAEGVEFSDGTVVVRWLDDGVSDANRERGVKPTTVMHPDIESVIALHGHNGGTEVEWTTTAIEVVLSNYGPEADEDIYDGTGVQPGDDPKHILNEALALQHLDGDGIYSMLRAVESGWGRGTPPEG